MSNKMMYDLIVLKVLVFLLIYIVASNANVIISDEDKYAGVTPCEDDSDCEHLLDSKCEDAACVCNGSKICEDLTKRVVTKVGETCSDNEDCNIENALCDDGKRCSCKFGFVESTSGKRCLIVSESVNGSCEESVQCYTKLPYSGCQENKCVCQQHTHVHNGSCFRTVELGQSCLDTAECSFTPFSECKNFKCSCIEKYVESTKRSRCLLVAEGIQSSCVDDAQCRKLLGGSSHCRHGICECNELYQLKNTTNKCVRDMLLGDICENHSDCHGPYPGRSRLDCILGVCKCKPFYMELDGYCISTSQNLKPYLLIIVIYQIYVIFSNI